LSVIACNTTPVVGVPETLLPSDATSAHAEKMKDEVKSKLATLGVTWVSLRKSAEFLLREKTAPAGADSTPSPSANSGYETLYAAGADRVGTQGENVSEVNKELACMIDHTILKPDSKEEDILNIQLKKEGYWKSIELPNGVVIDVGKDGSIVSIEILRASKVFSGDVGKVIEVAKKVAA